MFLSKLFSIFKRKKDNQPANNATPATGTVGAAVGLSQPNQAVTPGSNQVAQGPSEPDFPKPDVEAAADAPAPEPTLSVPTADPAPTEGVSAEPQPAVEEPPVSPEVPPAAPEEPPSQPPASDDNQNIAV